MIRECTCKSVGNYESPEGAWGFSIKAKANCFNEQCNLFPRISDSFTRFTQLVLRKLRE